MADKKLTTAEILALARQKDGKGDDQASAAPEEASAEEAAPEPSPAAEAPKPKPAGKPAARPGSTADILAAARAQAAGGSSGAEAKPAAEEKPAAKEKSKAAPAKPAASGARPKSTADILAAARAQKAGGAGGAAEPKAEKPAAKAKPAAAAKSAPPSSSGERPSVQEMLKRVRAEKSADEGSEKSKLPPLPQKPAPAKVPVGPPRRNFLLSLVATPFAAAWTAFTATSIAAALGAARFMMPNAVAEPPSKFKIGSPDDYPLGTVSTKWKSEYAIWITHQVRNGKPELYALSTVCTHLGCTPNWLEGEQKYKCPCHGSGFYADGINFEGPAPRPLERYGISIAADGMLEVDKSVKFQQELGQWEDATSFVATG